MFKLRLWQRFQNAQLCVEEQQKAKLTSPEKPLDISENLRIFIDDNFLKFFTGQPAVTH